MKVKLLTTLVILICISVLASRLSSYTRAMSQAALAHTELTRAFTATATIQELAPLPATAIAPDVQDADLLRDVQRALATAGVPSQTIRDLSLDPATSDPGTAAPGQARPVGLLRRSGRVSLDGLTLDQLGSVLRAWTTRLTPLRIEQLNIQRTGQPPTTINAPAGLASPPYRINLTFAALTPDTSISPKPAR